MSEFETADERADRVADLFAKRRAVKLDTTLSQVITCATVALQQGELSKKNAVNEIKRLAGECLDALEF